MLWVTHRYQGLNIIHIKSEKGLVCFCLHQMWDNSDLSWVDSALLKAHFLDEGKVGKIAARMPRAWFAIFIIKTVTLLNEKS